MKTVRVYVPVYLLIQTHDDGEETFELQLANDSISAEIDIIETDAINAYMSGAYEELKNEEVNNV